LGHARKHARARTHARTHTHTHQIQLMIFIFEKECISTLNAALFKNHNKTKTTQTLQKILSFVTKDHLRLINDIITIYILVSKKPDHNITFALKPYVCWGSHLRFADPFQQNTLNENICKFNAKNGRMRKRG
jgi:hypothetical protein